MMAKMTEVPREAKIIILSTENPRRPGTGAHDRARAVLSAKGATVETALKRGAKVSTVRHLVEEGLIRLSATRPTSTSTKSATKPTAKKTSTRKSTRAS